MPGVIVSTAARSGPSSPLAASSGQAFFVGLAERGPIDEAVMVRGLADFEASFGKRPTYSHLYDTVKTFFEEGGQQAYIARVVGPGANLGTASIPDRAGTPITTLTVTPASPGAWSTGLQVRVENGAFVNTVRVLIYLNGVLVEGYNNLGSPAAIVDRFSQSQYVKFVNAGSSTAAPANNPGVGTYSVSGGSDDRVGVTTDSYSRALNLFHEGLGDGAVSIPGVGASIHGVLIAHAEQNRRIALLSGDVDDSFNDLVSASSALLSDSAGFFAPWVQVSNGAGGRRNIPPEGYVAAVRARAHDQVGAFRAPAGGIAKSSSLLGLVTEFTKDQADSLDAAKVSVIRRVSNSIRLYGWRSLSNDVENFGFLNGRDLLNRIAVEAEARLEDYVFSAVDTRGQLFSAIAGELIGIVEPIRQAGGLYENIVDGEQIDPGYLVETGASVNTTASIARNEVHARLSIRVAPVGSFVSLNIVKVGIQSGF